jgi:hypothetical protein
MPDLVASARDLTTAPPDLASMMQRPDLSAPPPDLSSTPPPPDLSAPPSDLASGCVAQTRPCDVICQDCPAGQKCGASNGLPVCEPNGTVPTGMPCPATGDACVAGDVCVEYSTALGIDLCAEFCRTDSDCHAGGLCTTGLVGGNLKICSLPITNCDPVAQTGCQNGAACYPVTPSGQTGCHPQGPGTDFSDCLTDFDCAAGYSCFVDPSGLGPNTCKPLCHQGNDLDCLNPNYFCYNVVGWTMWGVCDF